VEANYLLREMVGADNYAPGFSDSEQLLVQLALHLQQESAAVIPDIRTIESADAILILGEDVTNTAPRIALALRQSVRNKAYALAADLKLETWQDAAIRNLAQDQRSPLFIATVADTPLDDVAEQRFSLAPRDIAALGQAVALGIAGSIDKAPQRQDAANIAAALAGAKRPLIIAGTGCGSADILQAAAAVANNLCSAGHQAMLCLCVPEANSLGQAMLAGPEAPNLTALKQRATAGEFETLIVMENDLFRRGTRAQVHELLESFREVIVLDGLDNDTTSAANLALPAANFAESEGTLVSLEGRAQRYYPIFQPREERRPAWVWLLACMKELERAEVENLHHFDDITRECAAKIPALAGITAAAPDLHYLNLGVKIPRQPPRYSGRTAMRANVSVHEPKQREDEETPLAFTMEGLNRTQPGALLPWVWSPGWNSNQSVQKFQDHPGGALKGGTAGARLLTAGGRGETGSTHSNIDAEEKAQTGHWQLVPRQRIFGSDELSALSPAIAELTESGFIEINNADATALGVATGDGLHIGDGLATLEVHVNDAVAPGCAGYSAGLAGTDNLTPLACVILSRADGWRRRPELIARERSTGQGGSHV
jgi:NADH-quinone oxidoreductase subunit G